MQVNSPKFPALFTARVSQRLAPPATEQPEAPAVPDTFLGRLTSWLGFKPTPAVRTQQNELALHTAVAALGAPVALALAQEVGMSLDDGKNSAGLKFKASNEIDPSPEPAHKMDSVWSKIVEVTGTTLDKPTLLAGTGNGPGRFVGSSLFADAKAFATLPEEVAIFYTAHEVGHVEHQDGARKSGMTELKKALPQDFTLQQARKDLDWEMEYGADARGAEIAAKAGCDPKPILKELLQEPSGSEHPPGIERARRVRDVMALHGQAVNEDDWTAMVLETAAVRELKQHTQDQADEWLFTMQNLQ